MITRINGQAQCSLLKYYSERCVVLVVEIVVGAQNRPLQYPQNLYQREHYHEIVHYRFSTAETPQHMVLENTLNMGFYFTWIKMM